MPPTLTRPYRLVITLNAIDFISSHRFEHEDVVVEQAEALSEAYGVPVGVERYTPAFGWEEI